MRAKEFLTETTAPGEYVYHASYGNQRQIIGSLLKKGLLPSRRGYAGPGVYFAYTPEVAAGWSDEPIILRVRWDQLVSKFGTYPKNANGIQRDDEEIIVPGVVPADLIEIEYFPGEWWDLDSAWSAENHQLTETGENFSAEQVLKYVKSIHHGFHLDHTILDHAEWTLTRIPLNKLHIPDPESGEDLDDPYNRAQMIDMYHVDDIRRHDIERKPIVVDVDGYIIDGNHRALAARLSGMRDIPAYTPTRNVQ